jgi:hypothetical protein
MLATLTPLFPQSLHIPSNVSPHRVDRMIEERSTCPGARLPRLAHVIGNVFRETAMSRW